MKRAFSFVLDGAVALAPSTMARGLRCANPAMRAWQCCGTIQFVAGAAEPQDFEGTGQVAVLHENGQHVLLVAVPERAAEREALQQQFPGGTHTTGLDLLGRLTGAAYRLSSVP